MASLAGMPETFDKASLAGMPETFDKASLAGMPETFESRTELLLGKVAMATLKHSRVLVVGLGGVGSHAAIAMCRSGIGSFVLIDGDVVNESNINRQAIAFRSTIGQRKTDVCADVMRDINPEVSIEKRAMVLLPENLKETLDEICAAGELSFIVDACDTTATKLALALYAQSHGIALVSSMGTANKLDALQFKFADLYKTSVCPLCKSMRHEARKLGIEKLDVLYSEEVPQNHGGALGSVAFVPPVAGHLIAGFVVKRLVGCE